MRNLLKIIEFIEYHSIDERVYLKLACKKNRMHTVEIMWERGSESKAWKLRPATLVQWQHFTNEQLIEQLAVEDISLEEFEEGLKQSIVSQAIYADYYYRQSQKLLGSEAILKSKKDTENFLAGLVNVINQSPGKSTGTRSTTYKSKRVASHLSLIKPENDRRNQDS